MLCQTADDLPDDESTWKVVTDTQPTDAQLADLRFAWAVCRHVKSNAIVLAKDRTLVGVGAGQMSRVDSVEIAIKKAGERASGAVLASDAFFPVRRFDPPRGGGRRRGHHPARRLAPRRRSDRRLQPARPGDDLHRPPAFPALTWSGIQEPGQDRHCVRQSPACTARPSRFDCLTLRPGILSPSPLLAAWNSACYKRIMDR